MAAGFVYEIAQRLVDQGVGVEGTSIFITSKAVIPTGSGPYLSITETGGSGAARTQNGTATERPTAQISVRASSSAAARTMAKAAYNAFGGPNGLHNVTLSGVRYLSITSRQEPTDIGMDATGNRIMFVFNIDAEKAPS